MACTILSYRYTSMSNSNFNIKFRITYRVSNYFKSSSSSSGSQQPAGSSEGDVAINPETGRPYGY